MDGLVEDGFEPLARELERQVAKRGGGAAVCAYHRGRCVVDIWDGVRDPEGTPWERDTLSVSFSTTKGVVATALHMCADRGLVDYDAPVVRYWPEFGQAGKDWITVRDVLVHRSGLFDIRGLIEDAREMLDWEGMIAKVAAAPAQAVPEGATAYQALTWGWVVGEIIRRASGKTVTAFVRDEIAGPLGLDGLYVGLPASELPRAARLIKRDSAASGEAGSPRVQRARRRQRRAYATAQWLLRAFGHPVDFDRGAAAIAPAGISSFDFSSDEAMQACIPAANGTFTARSLARMYQALARGGQLDGVRLMRPETLARATVVHETGFDQVIVFPMSWRLGWHRVSTLRGVPRRAFGHFGWGGSGAWADPTRQLSLGYINNIGSGTPIGDLRILRLNTILLECVRALRRAG